MHPYCTLFWRLMEMEISEQRPEEQVLNRWADVGIIYTQLR